MVDNKRVQGTELGKKKRLLLGYLDDNTITYQGQGNGKKATPAVANGY